jgi:hypothetical protein
MALRISPAIPLVSASRSWLARESLRTRRPMIAAGSTTRTTMPATISISRGVVVSSMVSPPASRTMLRRPMLTLEPTALWITVVSVVSRDSTSPVFRVSKNCGLCRSTCA